MQRVLTTVTLLGLLVATAAAFVITEHLKLIKSPVFGTEISRVLAPTCRCATGKATVRIRLRRRDSVTVTIVDSGSHTVATLASATSMPPRRPKIFTWDGRTDAGALAPDGVYYAWAHLASARRTFRFPNKIDLDTTRPKVLSARREKAVLFAGPGRSIAIEYAFSEPAHAVVYLGRTRLVVGHPTRTDGKIKWAGTLGGRAVRQGRYVLSIGARDVAGNETPASARRHVTVLVRYVEVAPARISVRAGGQLRVFVETAARHYAWRLGRRHGAHGGKSLLLHAPTSPGAYHLVITEAGHSATALVRVRAR